MLRLSRLSDYAVVLLSELVIEGASSPSAVAKSSNALGASVGLSAPVSAKVMKILQRKGLVVSKQGARGGYALARSPSRISVAEIIVSIEGPLALTACVKGSGQTCHILSSCPLSGRWQHVNRTIEESLERISLADMLMPAPLSAPPSLEASSSQGDKRASA